MSFWCCRFFSDSCHCPTVDSVLGAIAEQLVTGRVVTDSLRCSTALQVVRVRYAVVNRLFERQRNLSEHDVIPLNSCHENRKDFMYRNDILLDISLAFLLNFGVDRLVKRISISSQSNEISKPALRCRRFRPPHYYHS